ncbi:hypothetical protein PgNI_06569 [Pyricularia grisea]|uniref:Secreted protein n=1 Tax=Pyricularia grisea TaxID=148305 RepID=A0A6P8B567_PYRGI|nr:hypothetical protein PgNI_06569 [Pyricularia grisea]TLD10400.1 hypothetical protein PgNI_06569 [Pyricularia grisea]
MRFTYFNAVVLFASPLLGKTLMGLCSPTTGLCYIKEKSHKQGWHCDTPCLPPFLCGMPGKSIKVWCGFIP